MNLNLDALKDFGDKQPGKHPSYVGENEKELLQLLKIRPLRKGERLMPADGELPMRIAKIDE